ncbi:helix-turn-helix domain-containing protein [Halomonas sp. PAMB 3232]|uniref:helix-turn-helix domain-containing protein n=1 Tax=Halomonas sp. PAMB 3232 TaxID=3075221 RepID=UPI0028A2B311|nr:helix-turn-helix domain-containing protein [Halomonas sp. PAMB 3232]WNL37670.1 helix-turn-helix domain-containing protein [Halomonas sp. PAMB 3232]
MSTSRIPAIATPLTVTRPEDLGQLIRQTRKRQALTLETLAGLCGVSIRFLSELENGRASCGLGRVLLVLETLGIELSAQPTDIDT